NPTAPPKPLQKIVSDTGVVSFAPFDPPLADLVIPKTIPSQVNTADTGLTTYDSSSTPCRRKLFIPGWLQFRKRPSDTLSLRLSRTGSKFSMSVAPVRSEERRLETPCPPRRMSGRGKRNPCR